MTNRFQLAHPDQIFVAGRWIDANGGTINAVSPVTGEVVASVAEAVEPDMDAAVAAAREAFDRGPWPRLSPAERADWLRKMSAALEPRLPELCAAWVAQVGALATAAPFVIGGGRFVFDYTADQAQTYPFETRRTPFDGQGEALIVREPVGVVAAIAPWNNPFGIMAAKVAAALLAGCTVIMKPAPETPVEAYILAEVAEAVGLPAGVLNLVTAHRDAADYLVRHPGVDKVSFTGSVAAGRRIAAVCGDRLARCTLELGGKSAAIVLDDADIPAVAKALAATITLSCGQVCATLSRALVSRQRQPELVVALVEELKNIKVGDPDDPESQMGPLAMTRQLERVQSYIELGKSEGATLAFGGGRPAGLEQGAYIEPTLFTNVTPDMRIAQEEIFGPVLVVIAFENEADAIRIANDSDFGLFGTVFTQDREAAYRIARGVRTGTVTHNAFRFDPSLPFGGFKQSGIGREGGTAAIDAFTEIKSILLDA